MSSFNDTTTKDFLEQGSSQTDFDPNAIFQANPVDAGNDLFGDDLFGGDLFAGEIDMAWFNPVTTDADADTLPPGQEITANFVPSFGSVPAAPAAEQNSPPPGAFLSLPAAPPKPVEPAMEQDCLSPSAFLDFDAAAPELINTTDAANPTIISPRPKRRVDVPEVTTMNGYGTSSRPVTPLMSAASPLAVNPARAFAQPSRNANIPAAHRDFAASPQRPRLAAFAVETNPADHNLGPQKAPMGAAGSPTAKNRELPPPTRPDDASPVYRMPIVPSSKRKNVFVHYRPPASIRSREQSSSASSSSVDPLQESENRIKRYLRIVEPESRPLGKIKPGNNPKEWYPGLGRKLPAWGPYDKFSYTEYGELNHNLRLDSRDLKRYLQKPGLQLLIQRMPTAHNHRYPNAGLSAKCRYVKCPNRHSTIEKGHLRVALVEYPELSGKVLDPFHCAGYFHLWCLESAVDVVSLGSDGDFFRCDDRVLPYEANEPMTLSQEFPMRRAFREWMDAELKKKEQSEHEMKTYGFCAEPYDWASRVKTLHQGYSKGASLTEAMIAAQLASKPLGCRELMDARSNIGMSAHMGNLVVLEEMREQQKKRQNQHGEDDDEDRGDTERGRRVDRRRDMRRVRDARSLSPVQHRPRPEDIASYRERNCRTVLPAQEDHQHEQQKEQQSEIQQRTFPSAVPLLADTDTATRTWDRRERDLAMNHGLVLITRKRMRVQDAAEEFAVDGCTRKKQQLGYRFST